MEYNTTRNHLEMKEYGRHVQKMVAHLLTIEDKERRQKNANAVNEIEEENTKISNYSSNNISAIAA